MRSSEREKLLDDVLRDANYEAFRRDVYELSRAEFRRFRRRRTRAPLWFALAASIVIGAIVLSQPEEDIARPDIVTLIEKDTLPIIPLVQTEALQPVDVVRSLFDRSLLVETPRVGPGKIEVFRSSPLTVDVVNDEEMLALFPGRAAGFVHGKFGKGFLLFGPAESLQ